MPSKTIDRHYLNMVHKKCAVSNISTSVDYSDNFLPMLGEWSILNEFMENWKDMKEFVNPLTLK